MSRTYRDRLTEIAYLETEGPAIRLTGEQPHHWAAHCARLRLIYAPFPIVCYIRRAAMSWAGTAITDPYFGVRQRTLHHSDDYEWDNFKDAYEYDPLA